VDLRRRESDVAVLNARVHVGTVVNDTRFRLQRSKPDAGARIRLTARRDTNPHGIRVQGDGGAASHHAIEEVALCSDRREHGEKGEGIDAFG